MGRFYFNIDDNIFIEETLARANGIDIKKPKINDKKIRIKVSSRPCKITKKLLIIN